MRSHSATTNLDRLPPHSMEAEQGLIGSILMDPAESLPVVLERLPDPSFFYDLRHQVIYEAMVRLSNENKGQDTVLLLEEFKRMNRLEESGGAAYLSELLECGIGPAVLEDYAAVVKEQWALRRCLHIAVTAEEAVFDKTKAAVQILDDAERSFLRLNEARAAGRDLTSSELLDRFEKTMDEYRKSEGIKSGVFSGYEYLDNMTTGWKPGELVLVAGRPGTGKTAFAMNIADHLVTLKPTNVPVGVFSLEMSADQLISRMVFARAQADYQRWRTGYFKNDDVAAVIDAQRQLRATPLVVDDTPGLTVLQVRSKARRWVRRYGTKVVIVDYAQLLRPSRPYATREQEVAEISTGMKALAKELGIVLIVLAQLNREIDRDKKRSGAYTWHRKPELSDLRESGQLEADADCVIMFYLPKLRKEEEEFNDREDWAAYYRRVNGYIAKQRNGPTGDVEFLFVKKSMRFIDFKRTEIPDVPKEKEGSNATVANHPEGIGSEERQGRWYQDED